MSTNVLADLLSSSPRSLCVDDVLSALSGRRINFTAKLGNNGDDIIKLGCESAFARANIAVSSVAEGVDAIVIRGGGSLVDHYSAGIDLLRELCATYPDIPLVALPQSVKLEKAAIGPMLANRTSPAVIFARETPSYQNLLDMDLPASVHIALDHDMGFRLKDSEFLQRLQCRASTDHVLVCERGDLESATGHKARAMPGGRLKALIPTGLKRELKRRIWGGVRQQDAATSDFARQMLDACLEDHPQFSGLPLKCADISDRDVISFNGFCDVIAKSAAVLTNRLHVGVLSALLGKPTYLRSGNYYKVRAIYDYSMADWGHVTYVD